MRKGGAPKPGEDAQEAGVTPGILASLAAKIAPPGMCLNNPKQAIEAAARLIKCATEHLEKMPEADDEKARRADERAQLEATVEHADKYHSNYICLADAFTLQKEVCKGRRRGGPYKRERDFVAALRKRGLIWRRFDEKDPEETTPKAVEALFEMVRKEELEKDAARKRPSTKK